MQLQFLYRYVRRHLFRLIFDQYHIDAATWLRLQLSFALLFLKLLFGTSFLSCHTDWSILNPTKCALDSDLLLALDPDGFGRIRTWCVYISFKIL